MDEHAKDERLERLARLGVITRASCPGRSTVRCDARTKQHHDLICLSRDRVPAARGVPGMP